jgi:hypothetical protein
MRAVPMTIYAALAVIGTLLPLSQFLPWLRDHGLDLPRFVAALFVNRISSFFALDVIVSAVVVIAFVVIQGRRDGVRHRWVPILATLLVGGSSGLPIFLAMRERR